MMRNSDGQAPQGDLLRLRNWAKGATSEFVRNDELDRARISLEIIELSSQIERKLEELYKDGIDLPYVPEGEPGDEAKAISGYPVFFTKGEFLVKQGRTRDKRDIYEQKLPRVEFDRIVDALREISHRKQEFEIMDVLSLVQAPNYQIYLILGALQTLGLIQVPRRGMYSFVDPRRFPSESSSAWQKISANFTERR